MAYKKQNFSDGQTLKAEHLNRIEDGIANVSYDDLKDKPFYRERAVGTVLPETTIIPNSDMQATIGTKPSRMFAGETYTVNWNGTAYECVCSEMTEEGVTLAVLGNLGVMTGGEDTGEPFIVMAASPDWAEAVSAMGGYAMVYALDGSTIATLSIEGLTEIAHTLDPSYVPKMRDVSSAIVLDLDENTASIPIDAALRMDMAELQTKLVVIYEGTENAVSGLRRTEAVVDGFTVGNIHIAFQYIENTADYADTITLTFRWTPTGFSTITNKKVGVAPFEPSTLTAPFAYVYGAPIGGGVPLWYKMSEFKAEGVLLKSTTEKSDKEFLLTVDDTGTLSVNEVF